MNQLILELATIFKDYRKDEGLNPTPQIIERWINQFTPENREIILSEMIHIFKKMYLSENDIDTFLQGLIGNQQLTQNNPQYFWQNVSLLDIQNEGGSQHVMVKKFKTLILKTLNINVAINDYSKQHYIYLDDFLFSGMKLRTDLTTFSNSSPQHAKLDVIYIGYFTSGEYFVREKWFKQNNPKNIRLSIWRLLELENKNNCHNVSDILLPSTALIEEDETIKNYCNEQGQYVARNLNQAPNYHCKGNGIFSCEENRKILEKEFTLAGLRINSSIHDTNKRLYWKPLGLTPFKGLGFGAMISTYRNCPNNTPLALW